MTQNTKKLLLITDAWSPQTNGVVTTLKTVLKHLESRGYQTEVIHPGLFRTIPLPTYPEIRISVFPARKLARLMQDYSPDHVHIATEGTLGIAAKKLLDKKGQAYTTSLHTRFPEYVKERLPLIKLGWGYKVLQWFHGKASSVMVTTPSMRDELISRGLGVDQLVVWGRGVDCDTYQPDENRITNDKEPILMYVGRLAVEKNLDAFLSISITGKKVLVGDGPQRAELEKKYPDVEFAGYQYGEDLVAQYQRADVFVFPSRSDTFGLVMLEAMACGTPVAAYPVAGPVDVVKNGVTGCLHNDLSQAIIEALKLNRAAPLKYAQEQSWQTVTQRLIDCLVPITNQ